MQALALATLAMLIVAGCTSESYVGEGSISGINWRVTAYPQADEVCFRLTAGIQCTPPRPERRVQLVSASAQGSGITVVAGLAKPEVATVRLKGLERSGGGVEQEVTTVQLSFRSDLRAVAAGFGEDVLPTVVALLDDQGNVLEEFVDP